MAGLMLPRLTQSLQKGVGFTRKGEKEQHLDKNEEGPIESLKLRGRAAHQRKAELGEGRHKEPTLRKNGKA